MADAPSDETNESSDARRAVVVVVTLILLASTAWVVWAIRMGSGTPPEKAKAMSKNAERACVLEGVDPKKCEKIVGRHHRDCLMVAERKTEGIAVNEDAYLSCMRKHFDGGGSEGDE